MSAFAVAGYKQLPPAWIEALPPVWQHCAGSLVET